MQNKKNAPRHDGLDWLFGGGKMANVIRTKDWSKTALGPLETWPQNLRTTVSLCLASNFPIAIAWGPLHVQIYNDGYWPISGSKHPTSMGQSFNECWATAWPVIGEAFNKALAGETSYLENQRMFLDRNGYLEETFFTFSFSPIRDEKGGVAGLFHPVTETTGRMLSERRVKALRELGAHASRATSVIEACTLSTKTLEQHPLDVPFLLIYLVDETGTRANLAGAAGLKPGTKASPEAIDLTDEETATWRLANVAKHGKTERIDNVEAQFGPLQCGPYPEPLQTAFVVPLQLAGMEKIAGFAVMGVSTRRRVDEDYRAHLDLVAGHLSTSIGNARAYAEEKSRAEKLAALDHAKTIFFSNISHELRTPLTLILGPLEDTISRCGESLPVGDLANLKAARRNGLRLLKLVNTLLDFSRLEAGRTQAAFRPTDLTALSLELTNLFRLAIEKASLEFVIEISPLPEPVYVNAEMWEKIVLNLLSNALKFTRSGKIVIRQRDAGDHVELSVEDTGCGIPEHELQNVFKRFYRIESAEGRTHEGTGIGLALAEELVTLHGGTIRFVSTPGKGTTFLVSIPYGKSHLPGASVDTKQTPGSAAKSSAPFLEEAQSWLPQLSETASSLGQPEERKKTRVLLVDDNADMRNYIGSIISPISDVDTAENGRQALEKMQQRIPDLVITDIMMPEMNGLELLKAIKDTPRTSFVPVILVSARAAEESAVEGLEARADDYLVKPFSPRELAARVKTHLTFAAQREILVSTAKTSALGLMAGNIAHEINNPLAIIKGHASLLKKLLSAGATDKARMQKSSEIIAATVDRVANIAIALLKFSRDGEKDPVIKSSVAEIVNDALALCREKFNSAGVEIRTSLEEATVFCRPVQISQVILNLLINALHAVEHREERWVDIRATGGEWGVSIAVTDSGTGIEAGPAEQIFNPFFSTKTAGNGIGMGLSISKVIVDSHGGTIELDSGCPNTRFIVALPIQDPIVKKVAA